jgi:hypothetical protein
MSIAGNLLQNTSTTVVYTSTGNSAVTTAYLCNTSGSAVQANVYAVPNTATANVKNQIYANLTISGYDTYVMEWERLLFNNGDTLQIKATTANAVSVTVSFTGI